MLNLAKLIFGAPAGKADPKQSLIEAAIEKAVDVSDPRLRAISGYQRKLRAAAEVAVDYVLQVVDALPAPLAITPGAFGTDPQVRAFFGSAGQIKEVFSQSRAVRELMTKPENAAQTCFYGVLRMVLSEKKVLGSQLHGDDVQRDVLRTALNFGDHEVETVSVAESTLREAVKERVFVGLIEQALLIMAAEESRGHDLREQRAILKTKLNTLQARGLGLRPAAADAGGTGPSVAEIERQLETLDRKLGLLTPGGSTLEDHLHQLGDVLAHPDRYAKIELESNRVTWMGYKADASSKDEAREISYTRVTLHDSSFVALLFSYPCGELQALPKLSDPIQF